MKTLLKNGLIVNVFTDTLEKENILICDGRIIGVGDYTDADADIVEDVSGKIICPGFIDGHIHIESTMLSPSEFAKAALPHGMTAIVADPHEIANVAGVRGIQYMLDASEGLPMDMYFVLPSCVPATALDETGAVLNAEDLRPFYDHPRVLGLGEMMNYPGVLANDPPVMEKIADARRLGKLINGHAPMLTGKALDKYIAAGISDDHECYDAQEAITRIRKGQWVMIRQGTAARNLEALLPLFDEPYCRRCILVTDDRHPADLIGEGDIDNVIRLAVKAGKSPLAAIRMASLQAAEYFGIRSAGAIAPGYAADLVITDDLESLNIRTVYKNGKKVVSEGVVLPFDIPRTQESIWSSIKHSFNTGVLAPQDFHIAPQNGKCRVIKLVPNQLLTEEQLETLDFTRANGIDTGRDILKLAVIERHMNTGHKGVGYIAGTGMKRGAIASSVSHDSHNLIVIGANDEDMASAANRIRSMGGGNVVVADGEILAEMPLPIGGLMSTLPAEEVAEQNEKVRRAADSLGVSEGIEPFMHMAFISLSVIPKLKMSTVGLVNVEKQTIVPLFTDLR
ncbi:MAG: adenine deaminase [Clostridia bacterium]|nr:adenine deaminase [Clostridia bacterium]